MNELLKCNFCGKESPDVINYHQGTAYVNDIDNYVNTCPECKIKNDEYWRDMWADYYSGCL